ncbi:DMT family transporter [Patescibacteria group bacterium]|nr:DMT family transporter [Patescibacteria group bacterium]MBU1931329.1 DMT family transporter [Patescibacteria group bacterium]
MPTWLIFALTAAVLFGSSQVLMKKGLSNISPLWNNIIGNILALLWIPAALWLNQGKINWPSLPILSLLIIAASFYCAYPYALNKGKVALTGTVIAICPLFTITMARLFLKESINSQQIVGAVIILISIVLVGLPKKNLDKSFRDLSWLKWGLGYAFLGGTADFLVKISANQIGAYSNILILTLIYQATSPINYWLDKSGRTLPKFSAKKFAPTLAGIIVLLAGSFIFLTSFDYGPVSLISPVTGSYPVVTVLLATTFLKEKLNAKQLTGIIGVILGIILVGMG